MENETQREYSIGELADLAGVSTRTIRYYVSEGLLPPPVAAGPNSRYTNAHLDQLAIINHLKEQYLPLKEIRRRLIGHNAPEASSRPQADAPRSPAPAAAPQFSRNYALAKHARHAPPEESASSEAQSPMLMDTMPDYHFQITPPVETNWRRIQIADGAELLISEAQYERHRDKIDWLVQWAERVLE